MSTGTRPAGVSHDEVEIEEHVSRRQLRIAKPIEHDTDRYGADIGARLVDGCQRHRQQARVLDVVDADHPHLIRHGDVKAFERAQQPGRGEIVGADEAFGADFAEDAVDLAAVLGVHAEGVRLEMRVAHRLAVTADPGIDGGR